jgi:hypothetical protein
MSHRKHRPIPELTDKQLKNFWLKVDKRDPDKCWNWLAYKNTRGYGTVFLRPTVYLAHRIMYYLATGKKPGPLCVCHTCDNPGCCNPAHFFLGTLSDNSVDMRAKGRGYISVIKGVDIWNAKLTEEQVLEIRASGETQRVTAAKYGIAQSAVSKIKSRLTWKHV